MSAHDAVPAFLLAILFALPAGEAVARPPRVGEIRELRLRIDGLLREELTRRWYPRALDRDSAVSTRASPATGRRGPMRTGSWSTRRA
jgi:hypothetical protein